MASDLGTPEQPGKRRDASANRLRILAAARTVLAAEPHASMATIAAAAGLGRGTMYRHFPTRKDVLEAVRRQATDDAAADDDYLRPPGELANVAPTPLSVVDVLNKVPPHQLGVQVISEAQRLPGVSAAALYLIDLEGDQLRRLAGSEVFPETIRVPMALGPELPREGIPALRDQVESGLPGALVLPLYLRGRAVGVLVATSSGRSDDRLRDLAHESAVVVELTDTYTDRNDEVRRRRETTPEAEMQQSLLPPRIVRVGGATLAGNVLPGYEIGGDWFDYTDNPDRTWLGIADVFGTGVRAAGTAAVALGAFRAARKRDGATPATVIRLMHQTVAALAETPTPVSTTIATWQAATQTLQWICCGDVTPLLVDLDGELQPIGELLPPVGPDGFPQRLRTQQRRISPGSRVIFASDGILERRSESGVRFGIDGIRAALANATTTTAAGTVRAIEQSARRHADGPFHDDATLMVLVPSESAARVKSP